MPRHALGRGAAWRHVGDQIFIIAGDDAALLRFGDEYLKTRLNPKLFGPVRVLLKKEKKGQKP